MLKHSKILLVLISLFVTNCSNDEPCKCTGAFGVNDQEVLVPNVDCETGAPGFQLPIGLEEVEAVFLGCRETD